MVGRPLNLDAPTADLSRPSVARVCIEVDLLKKLSRRIWLKSGDSIPGFWQDIIYEKIPDYCKHYRRLSHEIMNCKHANPQLAKAPLKKTKPLLPNTKKYLKSLKRSQEIPSSSTKNPQVNTQESQDIPAIVHTTSTSIAGPKDVPNEASKRTSPNDVPATDVIPKVAPNEASQKVDPKDAPKKDVSQPQDQDQNAQASPEESDPPQVHNVDTQKVQVNAQSSSEPQVLSSPHSVSSDEDDNAQDNL